MHTVPRTERRKTMRKQFGSSRFLRGAIVLSLSFGVSIAATAPSHALEITDIPSLLNQYQPTVTVVGSAGAAVAGFAVAGSVVAIAAPAAAFTASFVSGGYIATRFIVDRINAPSAALPDTDITWGVLPKYTPGAASWSIRFPNLHPNGDDLWRYKTRTVYSDGTSNTLSTEEAFLGQTKSVTLGHDTTNPIVGVVIQVSVKNVDGESFWLTVLTQALEDTPIEKAVSQQQLETDYPAAKPFGCSYGISTSTKCGSDKAEGGTNVITKCQGIANKVITKGPSLVGGVANIPVGAGCPAGTPVEESGVQVTIPTPGGDIPAPTEKPIECTNGTKPATSISCSVNGVVATGTNPDAALDPNNPDRPCITGQASCKVVIQKDTGSSTVNCATSDSCSDFKTALANVANGSKTWAEQGYTCTFNGRTVSMNQCLGNEQIAVKNYEQQTVTPGTGTQASECVPSGTALLNPVSYVSMTSCLAQWAFVPKTPIGTRLNAVTTAFNVTPAGKIKSMLADFADSFSNLQTQPVASNCQGPAVRIPTSLAPGFQDTFAYPFNACEGIVKTLTERLRPVATGTVYVTGLLTAFNILLGAFGMSLRLPKSGGDAI